jgi:predicted amidohydrolase YtcJ
VNSKALAMARVTADTPDPLPGFSYFQRDAKTREPTGWLIEVPAVIQVMQAAAPLTVEYIAKALEAWLPRAAAAGITSLFDAGIQVVSDPVGLSLYENLERAKKLPFRVVASYYHNDPEVDPMPPVRRLRDRARTELVRAGVLKLNIDGVDAQHTAAMLDPYSDRPGARGGTVLSPALTRDIVVRADDEGFDVHFHAIGDHAVQIALNAVEAAIRANGARERRHTIAHIGLIADEDMSRFADLGVLAQFSAQWAVPDPYWEKVTSVRWGQLRGARTYRYGSLLRSGVSVSFGTDWPAAAHRSTFRPLDAIEAAVTRCELGKRYQTPLSPAQERITLEQAVRANTIGAARQLRLDDKVGTLQPGKHADLVVLDRDIFKQPAEQIHTARVLLTMMHGVIRHEVKQ